jgi:hypothetical protein
MTIEDRAGHRMRRGATRVGIAGLISVALVACGTDDGADVRPSPTPSSSSTTTTTPSPTPTPSPTTPNTPTPPDPPTETFATEQS